MTRSEYISAISKQCDRGGDKLIELLNRYGKIGLRGITEEEAREFYEELMSNPVRRLSEEKLSIIREKLRLRDMGGEQE